MNPIAFYSLCALFLAIKIFLIVWLIRKTRDGKKNRTELRHLSRELIRATAIIGYDRLVLSLEIKTNKRGRSLIEIVDATGVCVLRSPESYISDKNAMRRVLVIANSNIREMLDGATLVFEQRIAMSDPPPMPTK